MPNNFYNVAEHYKKFILQFKKQFSTVNRKRWKIDQEIPCFTKK